jgi:amino acid adenylation domain-containing protein
MTSHVSNDRLVLLARAIERKKAGRERSAAIPARPLDQRPLLGDMQRGLWVLYCLDPASADYNLASAYRLSGPIDLSRLSASFNAIVARHRLLRSTFRPHGDTAEQIVHPHSELAVAVVDADDGDLLDVAVAHARIPFDLSTGPVVRMCLVEHRPTAQRLLLLATHHLVADERSLARIWHELAEAYSGRLVGEVPDIQFDDYVHWATERDRTIRTSEIAWWRHRLDPVPDDFILPFERPVSPAAACGKLLSRTLDRGVPQRVRQIAAALGTTPFVVYAFAFRLLIERYAPGQRSAFATPASTRSHPAAGDLIGYFLNPVLIPTVVDEQQPVDTQLRTFASAMRELLSHASVPFDELVRCVGPAIRTGRHPLFQTMFVFQERTAPPDFGDVRLEAVTLDLGVSKFDLTLLVSEADESVDVAVEYRADKYDAPWMSALLGHYTTIIRHLGDHLTGAVRDVPMLTDAEEARLRTTWQGADLDLSSGPLLPQQIVDRARQVPTASAVIAGTLALSYAELQARALAIAWALAAQNIGIGDRVALMLDRTPQLIAALLGTQLSGAAYVPLDPAYPAARNLDVLEDAEVAAVLTTALYVEALSEGTWKTIDIGLIDSAAAHGEAPGAVTPDTPAYVLYTSGSTGRPKGVVVTHDNLRASTGARFAFYDQTPQRFLLVSSVAFDSSVAGIFWTLASGGTLLLPTAEEATDARTLARIVARESATTLLCVPSLYAQMLLFGADSLGGLTTVIVAGERCSRQLAIDHIRLVPQARLFNEYGPTEAAVWATVEEVTGRDSDLSVAIGRPIPGVRLHVLDPLGRRVPPGLPGQAFIAGPTVANGYWRRDDLTSERFVIDEGADEPFRRIYRTGDVMSWTLDGRLLFLGRDDDQIKIHGFRIEPGDVEAALLDLSDVEDAAVVARATDGAASTPTQLVAFIRLNRAGADLPRREALLNRLPAFMVPGRYVELHEMPRLPNGKIDRRRLHTIELEAEPAPGGVRAAPADAREESILSLWQGLLGRTGFGVTDNFFELGGHSLLVVAMIDSLERDHGVVLTAADVFQHPTVREIATRVAAQQPPTATPYAHLFPIQPTGQRMPFIFAVPDFFTQMLATRFRGERPVYGLRGVSFRQEGNFDRWPTLEALGRELADEIDRRFPDHPCILAGYSFGASMAFETARQMEARGRVVHRLYLITPIPIDTYRTGPFRLRIGGLRKPVAGLSFWEALRLFARDNSPLSRMTYRHLLLFFVIFPWRRLLVTVGRLRRALGLPMTPDILWADIRVERFRLHGHYRPGPIRTPTVIFNGVEPATDAAATWGPFFEGPLTIHPITDPHLKGDSIQEAQQVILGHLSDMGDA